MNDYNPYDIFDPHGVLQGVLTVLRTHASAITLQERTRIAMELVGALEESFNTPARPPEEPEPVLSRREQYELHRKNRPQVEPRVVPRRDPSMSEYSQYYD
ncbi:hypothetical protein V8U11_16025 [Pseudomonas chlororaphis]|uniref:hypothetical protein n=1 Tax=Pseudomonas chlororaphis TaxID=587753 RepID=UPI0030D5CEEE